MSGTATDRLLERLARWRTSLELHKRYAALPEPLYRRVQPWPAHPRPAAWILAHALTQVAQLEALVRERADDEAMAEALELMTQLANLVGAQGLERFIPLADPSREDTSVWEEVARAESAASAAAAPSAAPPAASVAAPVAAPSPTPPAPARAPAAATPARPAARPAPKAPSTTRSPARATTRATKHATASTLPPDRVPVLTDTANTPLHRATASATASQQIASNDSTRQMLRPGLEPTAELPQLKSRELPVPPPARTARQPAAPPRPALTPEQVATVVADATRLLGWGKRWHELPDAISRLADRPPVDEIRAVLRTRKAEIESGNAGARPRT
jgi:hypothetical protein